MKKQLLIALTIAAMWFAAAPSAQACNGFGYGGGYGWLYQSLPYHVPHFAAFPPVYYSYPVPRSYGYSPFAYPPHVMTPEIVGEVMPLEITNPHVPNSQQRPRDVPADRTASAATPEPLVILNPFVDQGRTVAQHGRSR